MTMRWMSWPGFSVLLWSVALGCGPSVGAKTPTCAAYVDRAIACKTKGAADRAMTTKLCKVFMMDDEMGPVVRKVAQCAAVESCAEFKTCVAEAKTYEPSIDRAAKVRDRLQLLEGLSAGNQYAKVVHECYADRHASAALEKGDEEAVTLAREYYGYCASHMVTWLESIPAVGRFWDVGVCYQPDKSEFWRRTGADSAQLKLVTDVCTDMILARDLSRIELDRSAKPGTQRFPHECNLKEAARVQIRSSPAAKRLFARFVDVCYHQRGYDILAAEKKRLDGNAAEGCSVDAARIVAGFRTWRLTKPAQEAVLSFWLEICKSSK